MNFNLLMRDRSSFFAALVLFSVCVFSGRNERQQQHPLTAFFKARILNFKNRSKSRSKRYRSKRMEPKVWNQKNGGIYMAEGNVIITREQQMTEHTWAMEDLYKNDEAWGEDSRQLEKMIGEFAAFRGHLKDSGKRLLEMLDDYSDMNQLGEKIYVYANQKLHENTGNGSYQQMAGESQVIMTMLNSATAFVVPEILGIPEELLEKFKAETKGLDRYQKFLTDIIRQKDHVLSEKEEELLAGVSEVAQGPGNIFSMFNNADIKFGDITDEKGDTVRLTQGRYISFLESKDRKVRKEAFETIYASYKSFQNTLAATYDANARQAAFFAKTRSYDSALAAALDDSNIPVHVYDNLIEAVHKNMNLMYRYVDLRKKLLDLDDLHMYDLHVSMVSGVDMKIDYEQAKKIVLEGLAPLGEEYRGLLQQGFESRWIDVYENEGKRTGAYSWGAYGTHPYVLLNHQNNLNSVFTLAHEMGHALHSYYSDENQPYIYAGYKIFVAEVASTCNEALLIHHLIEKTEDKQEKAYLINYFLDQFKSTLYRQTMFAEFEKATHKVVSEGGTLNAETLCKVYYNLNKTYFGDGMVIDDDIAYEWARIPHFYTPFYVYQYATGFSAAIAISSKILNGEKDAVENYKKFLSGGSSMDPIDLLKLCGVDMTQPEPVDEALKVFGSYLDKLEQLYR